MENNENTSSYETAFLRLEEILEAISSGTTPLEKSLKLFEEADSLILACSGKLNKAEHKIDTLIKNREGTLLTNSENTPLTQEFTRNDQPMFTGK